MTLVPFGEYLPDLPDSNNPGMTIANNCVPEGAGYQQFLSPVSLSDALVARARGHTAHENTTGLWFNYAGDATDLYMMQNTTWTVDAGTHTLGATDLWEFAHYGSHVYAVTISSEPVRDVVGTGAFATFMTSTNKPKAHHIGIIGDFLVLGDINDGAAKRSTVVWSALGDPADFDASAASQSGEQDLRGETSQVNHIFDGGRTGYIFTAESIWAMTFEGPPTIFRFDQVSSNVGMLAKSGGCQEGNQIFFLSRVGFQLMDATTGQFRPIGKNRVDNTVLGELDQTSLDRISCVADPKTGNFFFGYPTSGTPDKIIVYNLFQDRWSTADQAHEILIRYVSGGQAGDIDSAPLATRDIDTNPYNVDAPEFKGGEFSAGIFDANHKLATFTGTAKDAVFETGEAVLDMNGRSYVNFVRPIVEGATANITCAVGTREVLSGTPTFTSPATALNSEGVAPVRASGRYMRFRTTVTAGFEDAVAVEVDPQRRGRL